MLDTHAFLWWINDDARLSEAAREMLSDGQRELLFSAASGWEMAIKIGLGKLKVNGPLSSYLPERLRENSVRILPVSLQHAMGVVELPRYHRDPFDRLLVSQAIAEDLAVLTADPLVTKYPVQTVW